MQGYAWLYLIAYPIDYIIYAYNYIYGFSLFADAVCACIRKLGLLEIALPTRVRRPERLGLRKETLVPRMIQYEI